MLSLFNNMQYAEIGIKKATKHQEIILPFDCFSANNKTKVYIQDARGTFSSLTENRTL